MKYSKNGKNTNPYYEIFSKSIEKNKRKDF